MARLPLRLKASDRFSIAVTLAVLLASVALLPLTQDRSFLAVSAMLVLALGAISLVLRRLRVPAGFVLLAQTVFLAAYLVFISLGLGGSGTLGPRLVALYRQAIEHMHNQPAPMSPNPGVKLLFITAIGVIMIFTDVMAQTIERPLWTLAPLGFLFLVPALGLKDDIDFLPFAAVAVGYLLILLAEGIGNADRWPRGVRRSRDDRSTTPLAWRMAAIVAIPALLGTLLLGAVIPSRSDSGWGFKKPRGQDGPLQMADPTLDLRRNLNQPEDRQVIHYRTSGGDPVYLRMASLPVFNANGWQNAPMRLSSGSDLPPPPGYREPAGQQQRTTELQISDFRAEYLPMPFAAEKFNAKGEWAYDRDSLVVLATGTDRQEATRNLSYSVKSLDIQPDGKGLSSAAVGNPPDSQLTMPLPHDIPVEIINLTLRVTAQASTPALKAAAIQAYLRSPEFSYSIEPQPGSGYQALQNFLLRDKKGYCEQFAGAMGVMARIAGIPSRVAVGFLPGKRGGDGFDVSIREMHAWPELYFEGYGWVRFEPTPNIATPPAWTVQGPSTGGAPQPTATAEPTAAPTAQSPTPSPEPTQPPQTPPDQGWQVPWRKILLTAGAIVALAALAALPMLLRTRRRVSRLDGQGDPTQQVEDAWAEVRDSVVDYGHTWPLGSPRAIGAQVAHDLDPHSAEAMTALSLMVERARYARQHKVSADLSELTHQIRRGLHVGQDALGRMAATVWPRSIWVNLGRRLRSR